MVRLPRGKTLRFVCALILVVSIGAAATCLAADYPSKPVQIIVPFPPGGGADTTARLVTDKLSKILGQPVTIVNKTGGGGVIGVYAAKAAPADGYTILQIPPPYVMGALVTKGVAYNPKEDFIQISVATSNPNTIVVKKDARWKTLGDLIQEAKKNPGKITCGVQSYGSGAHFAAELFKLSTGTDITLVSMDGTAPTITAIMGGHIDFGPMEVAGTGYAQLKAGSLRGLAVMAPKRFKEFPNIPTTVESGYPKLIKSSYHGFAVKAGTPKPIVEKLDKALQEVLRDKEVIQTFENNGMIVENMNSEAANAFLAKEIQTWSEVAKAANIVPK